ncbi:MAG: hypothetical protein IPK13_07660 [Deltaproteobacteria bacterium]|nr:hypothetical protein [Deltaproteobacteria bacterium]
MMRVQNAVMFLAVGQAFFACGAPDSDQGLAQTSTSITAMKSTIVSAELCPNVPEALVGQSAYRFEPELTETGEIAGTLYLAPTNPEPGDEVFLFFVTRYGSAGGFSLTTTARFTTNGWGTFQDASLTRSCLTTPPTQVYYGSLGVFPQEADLQFAFRYEAVSRDRSALAGWMNNNRENYTIPIRAPRPLQWMGDTHLRQYDYYMPSDGVEAGHDLQVYTQLYPMGAARSVTLYWSDSRYSKIESVEMLPDKDFVGSNHSNAQWRGVIPADQVVDGRTIVYWLRAVDHQGASRWESNDRRNFWVTPRHFPVVWTGGFGSYRPSTGGYRERELFDADERTSTGCYAPGAAGDYLERAVRIYVPGITDRDTSDTGRIEAYAKLIQTEIVTESFPGVPEDTVPTLRFVRKLRNDFIYTFLDFESYCNAVVDLPERVVYPYKLRISTDGGRHWYWRGTEMGGSGGDDLIAVYARDCNYANLPEDCVNF